MRNNDKFPVLYVVVPCYNEQDVLPETAKRLKQKLKSLKVVKKINTNSKIVFINDGSRDETWNVIRTLQGTHPQDFAGINLSSNRGHQNALLAGLMTVRHSCDAIISMDADLQDDVEAIDRMVDKYREGFDVVYGVRSARNKDTFFKRYTAEAYYRIMNKLGANVVFNHADYRLMSRRVLNGLSDFKEVNLFLRGIIPMIGFESTTVTYERNERHAGESKYPLRKMIGFAIEGITSLSTKPIRIVTGLGICVLAIGILLLVYTLVQYFSQNVVPGWTSVLVSLWTIGGMLIVSMGIVGEYVGKIYLETKSRPRYIVQDYINQGIDKSPSLKNDEGADVSQEQ